MYTYTGWSFMGNTLGELLPIGICLGSPGRPPAACTA